MIQKHHLDITSLAEKHQTLVRYTTWDRSCIYDLPHTWRTHKPLHNWDGSRICV